MRFTKNLLLYIYLKFHILLIVYIRYTGANEYYKDIEPLIDPPENDQILNLISALRSKLAQYISALYTELLIKSNLTMKSYLKYNSIMNSSLVQTISFFNISSDPASTESNFFTSLIEFCEYIHCAKQIINSKLFNENDLDFLIATCIHFGFKSRKKNVNIDKIFEALNTIFCKYSADIEVPESGLKLNGIVLYQLFSSCNSMSLVFLKKVKDMILNVYAEYIKDSEGQLIEFNQRVRNAKITFEDSQIFIRNLNISHNLFIFTNFTLWRTCSSQLINLINKTFFTYQQANHYFHTLNQ